MKDVNDNQWETSGICGKCRRQKYCSTECTACKKRKNAIAAKADRKVYVQKFIKSLNKDS